MESVNLVVSDTFDADLGDFFNKCLSSFLDVSESSVDVFSGKSVNAVSLESAFADRINCYDLAAFYCHGNSKAFFGSDAEVLLNIYTLHIEKAFRGSIVYAMSCSTGKKLGLELIDLGCKAFIGFRDKFDIISTYEEQMSEILNCGVVMLLSGRNAQASFQEVRRRFKNFGKSLDFFGESTINDNVDNMILLGDESATISLAN